MTRIESRIFRGFPFIGYWSDRGKVREENEDSFYVPPQNLSPKTIQSKGYLCIVADGMGGHAKGEVASAIAAGRIAEEYYADLTQDPELSLQRAFLVANAQILSTASQPDHGGMGTTVVAAVVLGERVIVANVGDSRAYLVSQGRAIQITRDHSLVQDRVERGILTQERARTDVHRSMITRSLGRSAKVNVDIFRPDARAGDLLVLCSDGISRTVRPDEITRITTQNPPMEASRQMVALTNERGGRDNSTVVVLPVLASAHHVAPRPGDTSNRMLVPIAAGATSGLILFLVVFLFAIIGGQVASVSARPTGTPMPSATVSAIPAIAKPSPHITMPVEPTLTPTIPTHHRRTSQ